MVQATTTGPPSALTAIRRHVLLTLVIMVLCVGAAIGLAAVQQTSYTAEARLAVGDSSLSAQSVPGFALASQELAANYARYVNTATEQPGLDSDLGLAAGSVQKVSASPIPTSNVVRIEVTADSPKAAVAAASRVSDQLVQQVNDASDQDEATTQALSAYSDISNQVAAASQAADAAQTAVARVVAGEATGDLAALRQTAAQAAAQLSILQVQQEALGERYRNLVSGSDQAGGQLSVIQPAELVADDNGTRLQQYGLAGFGGGLVIAFALTSALERRGWSARRSSTAGRTVAVTGPREPHRALSRLTVGGSDVSR